jgi:hypothetical protein
MGIGHEARMRTRIDIEAEDTQNRVLVKRGGPLAERAAPNNNDQRLGRRQFRLRREPAEVFRALCSRDEEALGEPAKLRGPTPVYEGL